MASAQAAGVSSAVDTKVAPLPQTSKAASTPKKSEKKHISEMPMTRKNWYKHIDWLNVTLICVVPLLGCITAIWTPLRWQTAIWAVAYYFWTGLGITAGYHRLWSHCSYSATTPLRLFLAAGGAGAVEGSIRWWSAGHRAHHRWTDTTKDPYSVRKGLLYSHLGWMVIKQNPKAKGRVDISDLNEDPIVRHQHRHYLKWVSFFGLALPSLVAGFGWGDAWGGLIYAGILRIFFVQQATFCVNSLAHWLGDQPFDDTDSPRDHLFTALVTLGEGYHNFHHEFPSDYRNAIHWWGYDPTKWSIVLWKWMGLAYDLKQFRSNEIEKGRLQQLQKKLDSKRSQLDWGTPLDQLPVMEWDDYVEQAKNGRALIAIAGIIHDVTDFIDEHPGGKAFIMAGVSKDATSMFNGQIHRHHNAASNLLATMRVAVLRGGMEVEVWKRAVRENKDAEYAKDSEGNRIIRAGMQPTRIMEPVAMSTAA